MCGLISRYKHKLSLVFRKASIPVQQPLHSPIFRVERQPPVLAALTECLNSDKIVHSFCKSLLATIDRFLSPMEIFHVLKEPFLFRVTWSHLPSFRRMIVITKAWCINLTGIHMLSLGVGKFLGEIQTEYWFWVANFCNLKIFYSRRFFSRNWNLPR